MDWLVDPDTHPPAPIFQKNLKGFAFVAFRARKHRHDPPVPTSGSEPDGRTRNRKHFFAGLRRRFPLGGNPRLTVPWIEMEEKNHPRSEDSVNASNGEGRFRPQRGPIEGRPPMPPPITLAILVICVAIWACLNFLPRAAGARAVAEFLVPTSFEIWSGAYWALITVAFVHVDLFHGLFNMWWTRDFGRLLEPRFGVRNYVLFVVCSAIVAAGWQLGLSNQTGIGFSGVVYSYFGYTLAARDRDPAYRAFLNRNTIAWMIGWFFLCIVLTRMGVWNIANGAHGAGLIFGYVVGVSTGTSRYVRPAQIAVAILAAGALVPLFYMPWSEPWRHREELKKYLEMEKSANRLPFDAQNSRGAGVIS